MIVNSKIKDIKNESVRHVRLKPIGGQTKTVFLDTDVDRISGSNKLKIYHNINILSQFNTIRA